MNKTEEAFDAQSILFDQIFALLFVFGLGVGARKKFSGKLYAKDKVCSCPKRSHLKGKITSTSRSVSELKG